MNHATVAKHDIARFLLSDEESVHVEELLVTLMDLNEVPRPCKREYQNHLWFTPHDPRAKNLQSFQAPYYERHCGGNVAVVFRSCVPEGIGAAYFLHSTGMGSSNLK
ncbi:hypothetical protein JG687_00018081 [Phytophthora cactorum]|uniref:Uncharacterized protein n=1 Tax=Phytophthora cactorum TaxID=29920 RepID=A0A8T1TLP1_9STRA|nr:hypothetical protein JG687_00018081 [Phytophthora cactorum]